MIILPKKLVTLRMKMSLLLTLLFSVSLTAHSFSHITDVFVDFPIEVQCQFCQTHDSVVLPSKINNLRSFLYDFSNFKFEKFFESTLIRNYFSRAPPS